MPNQSTIHVPKSKAAAGAGARREDRRVLRTKRAPGVALVDLMMAEEFDAIPCSA